MKLMDKIKAKVDGWICRDCKFMRNPTTKDGHSEPVCTHPHGHETPCMGVNKCDAYVKKDEHVDEGNDSPNKPTIKDSGARTEFETGAVRDIQDGKGRCDLMPLDVMALLMNNAPLTYLNKFKTEGTYNHLYMALRTCDLFENYETMMLEVSIHFEEGAKKYGENNWQKGIPVKRYIDSAIRHYLKHLRGDRDEPHDRAFCWNIMCAIWTCKHKPELNNYLVLEDILDENS